MGYECKMNAKYYIFCRQLDRVFSTTKHDNTAKHQNNLYIGEFYIIFLILQKHNKF